MADDDKLGADDIGDIDEIMAYHDLYVLALTLEMYGQESGQLALDIGLNELSTEDLEAVDDFLSKFHDYMEAGET